MARPIRRIVTGHDKAGRSVFIEDQPSPFVRVNDAMGGMAVTELWATERTPASIGGNDEGVDTAYMLEPALEGSKFRVVEYPPDSLRFAGGAPERAYDEIGGRHAVVTDGPHPGMHKTRTIDYAVVLSGEIWAVMDEGERRMLPGDCLVQRGTSHAWSNRTNEPAQVAFILISAEPL